MYAAGEGGYHGERRPPGEPARIVRGTWRHPAGQVPRRARARAGRHGRGRGRDEPRSGRARGAEAPLAGHPRVPAPGAALPPRSSGDGEAPRAACRPGVRRGTHADGRAFPRDGVPRRSGSGRRHGRGAVGPLGRRCRRLRAAGYRGRRRGARARHRAPRPEAGEPFPHRWARRHTSDQGPRFWHCQDLVRRDRRQPHRHDRRHGLSAVHVARASPERAERRRPVGRLVSGGHPVRAALRRGAVRRRDPAGVHRRAHRRPAQADPRAPHRRSRRAGADRPPLPRKASRGPLSRCGGAGPRARSLRPAHFPRPRRSRARNLDATKISASFLHVAQRRGRRGRPPFRRGSGHAPRGGSRRVRGRARARRHGRHRRRGAGERRDLALGDAGAGRDRACFQPASARRDQAAGDAPRALGPGR